ncbi:hypothetical protein ACFY8O_18445 [Streptomyces argenteolus]|uniref:Secreted protein n=1 Tax=Streptomyces argenteolus TaxID=67274 RepID=A0ABW6X736_9ACTN
MPGAVRAVGAFSGAVRAMGAVWAVWAVGVTVVLGPVRSVSALRATLPAAAPPEFTVVAAVSGTSALTAAVSAAFTSSVPAAESASAAAGTTPAVPCQEHLPPQPQEDELGAEVEHDCLLAR